MRGLRYNTIRADIERLPEPDPELWLKITNLYNRERRQKVVSIYIDKVLDPETVKMWLEKTAV